MFSYDPVDSPEYVEFHKLVAIKKDEKVLYLLFLDLIMVVKITRLDD